MLGAGPRRATHSSGGRSGVSTKAAPRGNSVVVFLLLDSSADFTPWRAARSNSVGASSRSDVSMYSSRPVRSSKYELPVIPCVAGHAPLQIDALFVLVTAGIPPGTILETPSRRQRSSVGMGLAAR